MAGRAARPETAGCSPEGAEASLHSFSRLQEVGPAARIAALAALNRRARSLLDDRLEPGGSHGRDD